MLANRAGAALAAGQLEEVAAGRRRQGRSRGSLDVPTADGADGEGQPAVCRADRVAVSRPDQLVDGEERELWCYVLGLLDGGKELLAGECLELFL